MQLISRATLRGKDDTGEYAKWPEGSIFDSDVHPIPKEIIEELEAGTGTIEEITPDKLRGGPAKSSPNLTDASQPINNKKQAVKEGTTVKAKTKKLKTSTKKAVVSTSAKTNKKKSANKKRRTL